MSPAKLFAIVSARYIGSGERAPFVVFSGGSHTTCAVTHHMRTNARVPTFAFAPLLVGVAMVVGKAQIDGMTETNTMSKIADHAHALSTSNNRAADAVRAFTDAWNKFPVELRQRVWDLSVREEMEATRKRASGA